MKSFNESLIQECGRCPHPKGDGGKCVGCILRLMIASVAGEPSASAAVPAPTAARISADAPKAGGCGGCTRKRSEVVADDQRGG